MAPSRHQLSKAADGLSSPTPCSRLPSGSVVKNLPTIQETQVR